MASNTIFFGWDRPLPGREQMSAAHFQEFVQYVSGLQQSGAIDSWEYVFLDPHAGDLNGFILIKGSTEKIYAVLASEEWANHMMRATQHLAGAGSVTGATGDLVMERFATWSSMIPG